MKPERLDGGERCDDVWMAAAVFALDPAEAGGLLVRARAGPVRDRFIGGLNGLLDPGFPVVKLLPYAHLDRVIGGLDLAATLDAGRPMAQRGILANADGGALIVPMAERLPAGTVAAIASAIDDGSIQVERDGLSLSHAARFGLLAMDEGFEPGEGLPLKLRDRIGGFVDLGNLSFRELPDMPFSPAQLRAARNRLPGIRLRDGVLEQVCGVAAALGIGSLRPAAAAAHWATAAAALHGRAEPADDDVLFACRTTLLPRANRIPMEEEPDSEESEEPENDEAQTPETGAQEENGGNAEDAAADRMVEAARAVLPAHLLKLLDGPGSSDRRIGQAGRTASSRLSGSRGRPAGVRPGTPGPDDRLNAAETLRAAIPWQRLRTPPSECTENPAIRIRRSDFRLNRYRQRIRTTTIFVVDASGSAALHRLAEAKGAVELLLAESYIRRDEVALIAFSGTSADLLLPPTPSVARAKRNLCALPGGGGTPLASGIDAALRLALAVRAKGNIARLVILTDGRANIGLDGTSGRRRAEADALSAAKAIRRAELAAVFVDISPTARPFAEALAREMDARYVFMPRADSAKIHTSIGAGGPWRSDEQRKPSSAASQQ